MLFAVQYVTANRRLLARLHHLRSRQPGCLIRGAASQIGVAARDIARVRLAVATKPRKRDCLRCGYGERTFLYKPHGYFHARCFGKELPIDKARRLIAAEFRASGCEAGAKQYEFQPGFTTAPLRAFANYIAEKERG